MLPKSANDKLRKFFDEEQEVPSYLKGQPLDNGLAVHWREYAEQELRDLKQQLEALDALTGPEHEAAEKKRAEIEARIGELVGDLLDT